MPVDPKMSHYGPKMSHYGVNPANRGSEGKSQSKALHMPALLAHGWNLINFRPLIVGLQRHHLHAAPARKEQLHFVFNACLAEFPLLYLCSYIALTNQTTYEVARRKRIFYLRGIPDRVHPFSKGICRNIYDFCFTRENGFVLEAVPPIEELEARAAPYTCRDLFCCRCC
uniref:S-acyltransferase n=1 Tax=Aegilops tauschii subsp. strangulata TaxID=200361 RepID=A0A453P954_AEGTS